MNICIWDKEVMLAMVAAYYPLDSYIITLAFVIDDDAEFNYLKLIE